ncbi:MAG TPA: PHP domain-containing protein [Candidatus Limnocylindrales bacterium]|nr:PHP domain-containing protein [Candidatus Limnocylindrales bacterium]
MQPDRAFVDLHCHTSASFDSLASPASVVRAAAARGLTHLAITDHDRIDGALEAEAFLASDAGREAAPGLSLIVGQEIRTSSGDLIGVFMHEAVPPGLPPAEAIAAVRAQGGLVGMAHPFDRFRGSVGRGEAEATEEIAASVDWIEAWNARLMFGDGNARAAALAATVGKPGIAVSDSHTTLELGVAATILHGDLSSAEGLRAALGGQIDMVMGRGSAYARLIGPAAKLVQRARGRGRVKASVGAR